MRDNIHEYSRYTVQVTRYATVLECTKAKAENIKAMQKESGAGVVGRQEVVADVESV